MRRSTLGLRVLLPFAFGYFLSYLFRVINAVIAPDLVATFAIEARRLGLLTGAYFLTFAAAQLPLGIVLDRFGPRRTEAALLTVAAAGAVVFATADSFPALLAGRALIGFGVSACLMAAFKAFVIWFPPARLPFVNGCQMAAGGLGAIMATAPVQAALDLTSWRQVFLVLAAMSLVAALAILLIVPREERSAAAPSARDLFSGTGRVFASRTFWRIAPLTVASQATFFAIQGLWAGPWLTHVAGLPRAAVARQLSLVAAAMIAGFLILGWTAERLGRKGVGIIAFAVGCMLMFMAAQLAIIAGWGGAGVLPWLAFGFFGTSGILPYAGLSQRFPAALAGRVNTSLNVLVFVAAFAAQAGMGAIIDWQPAAGAGTAGGYRAAFALMLLLQGIGLVWFLVCRHDPPVRR